MARFIKWGPFTTLSLIIFYTVVSESGWSFYYTGCDVTPAPYLFLKSLHNIKHILVYGILFLTCVWNFRSFPILKATSTVMVFSLLIELVQIYIPGGHCRVYDMLSNAIGVIWASLVFLIVLRIQGERGK